MPQITNNLNVFGTNSAAAAQKCTFNIASPAWIFSYKCCEVENGILSKGGDYAFTLTFGNMGECPGTSFVWDVLSVKDIGGIQLKIMDVCGNTEYDSYFLGLFYYPAKDNYFYSIFSLDIILQYNLELVVTPFVPMFISLYDDVKNKFIVQLDSHTINCLGMLFQVSDLFCETCPVFNGLQENREKEALTEIDFRLPPKELDLKLKELKAKCDEQFEAMK